MKKISSIILIAIAIVFLSNSAFCQKEKGSWALHTASTFNFQAHNNSTNWNLNFSTGYFIADKTMLSFGVGYMDSSEYSGHVEFGIGARRYFKDFFAGAGFSILTDFDYSIEFANVHIGHSFFITERLAFEPTFSYSFYLESNAPTGIFNATFGFAYYF